MNAHGSEGHFNVKIPGTIEHMLNHLFESTISDVFNLPQNVSLSARVVRYDGFKKAFVYLLTGDSLEFIKILKR